MKTLNVRYLPAVLIVSLVSCNLHGPPDAGKINFLIDSLIQVNRINEKTVLVSFGSDAITAINTEEGIVLIDAGISTQLTKKYRKKIEDEFNNSTFAYVINTHAHHDHIRGNSVFPEAEVAGHINGLKETEKYWEDGDRIKQNLLKIVGEYDAGMQNSQLYSDEWFENFKQKTRYQFSYYDAENSIPVLNASISFLDTLNIMSGDITFEMKYFGTCHSNSDIVIYVPELKLLFTGDLMFQYGKPSIDDTAKKDRDLWIKAIRWIEIRKNNIETIVGGHGQILTPDDLQTFTEEILHQDLNE